VQAWLYTQVLHNVSLSWYFTTTVENEAQKVFRAELSHTIHGKVAGNIYILKATFGYFLTFIQPGK